MAAAAQRIAQDLSAAAQSGAIRTTTTLPRRTHELRRSATVKRGPSSRPPGAPTGLDHTPSTMSLPPCSTRRTRCSYKPIEVVRVDGVYAATRKGFGGLRTVLGVEHDRGPSGLVLMAIEA